VIHKVRVDRIPAVSGNHQGLCRHSYAKSHYVQSPLEKWWGLKWPKAAELDGLTARGNRMSSPIRRRTVLASMITIIAVLAVFSRASLIHSVSAQSSSIDLSKEYASGDVDVFPYLQAWYTWININGTHTIFLALHSNQVQSPVSAFVGQGYNTTSGSKVFVANALLAMEVYNDTNGNGYLDANYGAGTTELKYLLVMNASQTFTVNPDGNTTYLKTSYDIGNVALVLPTDPGVTLQGLSFSLLHTTLAVASHQLSVVAGSNPYDSQTSTSPSLVTAAQLSVDNGLTYEFRFRDNYTLVKTPTEIHPALYIASPVNSLPAGAFSGGDYTPLIRVDDYVRNKLPDIAGLPSTSDLNYGTSRLFYRVSYPAWSGYGVKHDPTYVAHFAVSTSSPIVPTPLGGLLIVAIAAAGIAGVFLLVLVVSLVSRARRHSRIMISENRKKEERVVWDSGGVSLIEGHGTNTRGTRLNPTGLELSNHANENSVCEDAILISRRLVLVRQSELRKELVGVPNPVTSSYPRVVSRLKVWSIVRRR